MPLKQRLPKFGFTSRKQLERAEVRLSELNKLDGDVVDLLTLKKSNIIRGDVRFAKLFLSGSVDKAYTVKGVGITKGAKAAIEAAGGKVED